MNVHPSDPGDGQTRRIGGNPSQNWNRKTIRFLKFTFREDKDPDNTEGTGSKGMSKEESVRSKNGSTIRKGGGENEKKKKTEEKTQTEEKETEEKEEKEAEKKEKMEKKKEKEK